MINSFKFYRIAIKMNLKIYTKVFVILALFEPINSYSVTFCNNVQDFRNTSESATSINIPGFLLTNGKDQRFTISKSSEILACTSILKDATLSLIAENDFNEFATTINRIKGKKSKTPEDKAILLRNKSGTQFTPQGYLEYNDEYYKPEEYCISRITDEELEFKICSVTCDGKNNLCFPKCCGIGEIAAYWNFTCIPEGNNSWSPFLYKTPRKKLNEKEIKALNIHYTRPFLHCKRDNKTQEWQRWPFSTVVRPKKKNMPPDSKSRLRVLSNGDIVYLDEDRQWKNIPKGEYCIDGFANWGFGGDGVYTGHEDHQVLLKCDGEPIHIPVDPWVQFIANLYAYVLFASSIFLLLTALVHIALFDKQNIHGLTILSQTVSLFFMYIFHGLAYFVSQRRNRQEDYRSPSCMIIAIASHFFFLTTFVWLSVVNFDLWLTFRSMRPVSKMSKKMRRFTLYTCIGWGIPLVLTGIFVALDFIYRDIESEVIVPDYGEHSCFVATWARWHYQCSILAIVIPINLIMIASTFKIFYDFKKGKGPVMTKRAKSDKYSFKLFLKLFLVMGAIWCFELIFCWTFNTGKPAPWFIIILDFAMFFQAIAIFLIFCWNRRTLNQLEEKFPRFKVAFAPMRKLLRITEQVTEASETTPATPGGMRKMSANSVISQEGASSTLDRRRF